MEAYLNPAGYDYEIDFSTYTMLEAQEQELRHEKSAIVASNVANVALLILGLVCSPFLLGVVFIVISVSNLVKNSARMDEVEHKLQQTNEFLHHAVIVNNRRY